MQHKYIQDIWVQVKVHVGNWRLTLLLKGEYALKNPLQDRNTLIEQSAKDQTTLIGHSKPH